jgi:hypothetical protein
VHVCTHSQQINALKPFLKNGWNIANTSNSPDAAFFMDRQVRPNLTVYSDKEPSIKNQCRVCDLETFVEFKLNTAVDRFTVVIEGLEKDTGDARYTHGQLITYLNSMQAAQYRTHGFGARTPAGFCVTLTAPSRSLSRSSMPKFHLQTFFWRLSHADPAVRGFDTTFQSVSPFDAAKARSLLGADNESIWKVTVIKRSFYVACTIHMIPSGVAHTASLLLIARQKKSLLKDTWRSLQTATRSPCA